MASPQRSLSPERSLSPQKSKLLKVVPKTPIFAETGSAFDTTDIGRILTRPGSHDCLPAKQVDPSAFSLSKRTPHANPNDFVKKGTGSGGMLVSKRAMSPSMVILREAHTASGRFRSPERSPNGNNKSVVFPAYCPRPNPPNTELRRFVLCIAIC
jgi:hypothetical protein